MEQPNLLKNTILISKQDFKEIYSGRETYSINYNDNSTDINLEIIRKMLVAEEYYDQLLTIFQNDDPSFRIAAYLRDNQEPFYIAEFHSKNQFAEGLKLLYDEETEDFYDGNVNKRCSYFIKKAFESIIKGKENIKYKCVVDNQEYEINTTDMNQIMEMNQDTFEDFCKSDKYKTIEDIPKEVFFYIFTEYLKSFKEKEIILPIEAENKLKKLESYELVDFQALNQFNSTTDTIYKKVKLDNELKSSILDGLPEQASELEKAVYIYIKMCKAFTYDEEYYAINQQGKLAEKHRTIDYIKSLNKDNKKLVCYEFNAIYANLLSELGINFKSFYATTDKEEYGRLHAYLKYRIGKYIIHADSTTSILSADLMNAKVNNELNGLWCSNRNKETKNEFEEVVEKMYNLINKQENEKRPEKEQSFEELIQEYGQKTTNFKEIPVKDRVDILVTAVDEKKLEKSDAFGYAKYLTELLNDGNDFGIFIIGYDPNNSNQNPTTTAIIWMNDSEAEPFFFETGEETSLEYGRCTYFIYNPNTEMVKIPYQDLKEKFNNGEYYYLGETDNLSMDIPFIHIMPPSERRNK